MLHVANTLSAMCWLLVDSNSLSGNRTASLKTLSQKLKLESQLPSDNILAHPSVLLSVALV